MSLLCELRVQPMSPEDAGPSPSSRYTISYMAGPKESLTGWNSKMNVLDRFKASLQVVWTCIFCYSTLSLLGLGFINLGASCDKPLAEVLIGYGLLFLFGLVLEIMGMFRADETKPMPINIAMGKMLFLVLCLLWTMISNIWTFSSVTCRGARTWNRVGLQKGAIGITIWMNIFCAIVLAFLFLILYGTCKGLVGYAYSEKDRPVYLPYLASYDSFCLYLGGSAPNDGFGVQAGLVGRAHRYTNENSSNEERVTFLSTGDSKDDADFEQKMVRNYVSQYDDMVNRINSENEYEYEETNLGSSRIV